MVSYREINKTEINIKIRTGDICENCIEKIKSHIDFDDVYFILKFLDEIRNETLRTIRYYNINKNVSRIHLIKNSKWFYSTNTFQKPSLMPLIR